MLHASHLTQSILSNITYVFSTCGKIVVFSWFYFLHIFCLFFCLFWSFSVILSLLAFCSFIHGDLRSLLHKCSFSPSYFVIIPHLCASSLCRQIQLYFFNMSKSGVKTRRSSQDCTVPNIVYDHK